MMAAHLPRHRRCQQGRRLGLCHSPEQLQGTVHGEQEDDHICLDSAHGYQEPAHDGCPRKTQRDRDGQEAEHVSELPQMSLSSENLFEAYGLSLAMLLCDDYFA